jgi:hypothetical protein
MHVYGLEIERPVVCILRYNIQFNHIQAYLVSNDNAFNTELLFELSFQENHQK